MNDSINKLFIWFEMTNNNKNLDGNLFFKYLANYQKYLMFG